MWQHARDLLEIRAKAPGNRLPDHLMGAGGSGAGEAGSA